MPQTLRRSQAPRKRPAVASDAKLPLASRFCRCSACGAYFKCDRSFQRHRVGVYGVDRSCAQTARMSELGLQLIAGIWRFPKRAFDADRRRKLEKNPADIARLEVAA